MNRYLFVTTLILTVLGCTSLPPFYAGDRCETARFSVDVDFQGGAMGACRASNEYSMDVLITPESDPINPSPWYALRLSPADALPVTVDVHLIYKTHPHRYRPKVSLDGNRWRYVDDKNITATADGMSVRVRVELTGSPVYLSGQELVTRKDYDDWLEPYRNRSELSFKRIGYSVESRPIELISSHAPQSEGSVILVGRQHPPELTGAIAMMSFVEEVLGDSQLAREFRRRFSIFIVPLLNPDGVEHGFWRHNIAGTDLNRDWGPFEQPETRSVAQMLDQISRHPSTEPIVFLDFHSTRRNVFYTQPLGQDGTHYRFTHQWLERGRSRLPHYAFERAERHQSELATSKNYIHGRFGIPAITYEVGDESDRTQLKTAARVFAAEMMSVLLQQRSSNRSQ